MNIDINLVNSLKVGEFIKVSETEVMACLEWTKCSSCVFDEEDGLNCPNCYDGYADLMYQIFKEKQLWST